MFIQLAPEVRVEFSGYTLRVAAGISTNFKENLKVETKVIASQHST
jgi:hypothetical protein